MFQYSCFLTKNSHSIRFKLLRLGFRYSNTFDESAPYIFLNGNVMYDTKNLNLLKINIGEIYQPYGICCGDKQELFFAISALNDKYNRNQYFICHEDFQGYKKGDWVLCESEDDICATNPVFFHKADINDIITYFKNKI